MEWTIDYLEEEGAILLETSGQITWDELWRACEETLLLGREHNTHKFLADHRDLKPGLTILQIDDMPGKFREIGVEIEDRIAVLYDRANERNFKFFQSVSNIASLNFRIFTDENKAMAWLKSGKQDSLDS
jgi:hypothetical protein